MTGVAITSPIEELGWISALSKPFEPVAPEMEP